MSKGKLVAMVRVLGLVVSLLVFASFPAQAKSLISDISDHLINIDSKFTGTDILLFGARNDPGDIIVVVRGPSKGYIVRKKERIAGIWVNRQQVRFENIDSFYTIASSRPLYAMKSDAMLSSLGIGMNNLPYRVIKKSDVVNAEPYKNALRDYQLQSKLYLSNKHAIPLIGEILFRVVVRLPDNIQRGVYTAETYLVNNGQLLAMQSTPIIVQKTGFDAYISDIAHDHAIIYGLTAVAMALFAGWMAGIVFRKL
jgi:uncharacterized protein (TIGR02186 family)